MSVCCQFDGCCCCCCCLKVGVIGFCCRTFVGGWEGGFSKYGCFDMTYCLLVAVTDFYSTTSLAE